MKNAIYYVSFKLKKGTDEQEFLSAVKVLNDEHISKQKGYISWQQMRDGDTWADMITFETMDDLKAFQEEAKNPNALAEKFYSFINLNSCKAHNFSVEATHQ